MINIPANNWKSKKVISKKDGPWKRWQNLKYKFEKSPDDFYLHSWILKKNNYMLENLKKLEINTKS